MKYKIRKILFVFVMLITLISALVFFSYEKKDNVFKSIASITNSIFKDNNTSAYLSVLSFKGYEYANKSFSPEDEGLSGGNPYVVHVFEDEEVNNMEIYYEKESDDAVVTYERIDEGLYEVVCENGENIMYYEIEAIADLDIADMPYDKLNYDGKKYQTYVVPRDGTYQVELWGASGGNGTVSNNSKVLYYGGYGAYTKGDINLKAGDKLYVYIGGAGTSFTSDIYNSNSYAAGGFNGGGVGVKASTGIHYTGGGGGASDIRLVTASDNSEAFDPNSLKSRIMVAAGGGGGSYGDVLGESVYNSSTGVTSYYATHSSAGGGLYVNGLSTTYCNATQTSGYARGMGSIAQTSGFNPDGSTAGGGGYFGGEGFVHIGSSTGTGCGGTSYISGHTGSVGVDQDGNALTGLTTDRSTSYHSSGYVFTNTKMIDGFGCRWTDDITEDCSGMPSPDGTGTITGKVSSGAFRIKQIAKYTTANNKLTGINYSDGTLSPAFDAEITEYTLNIDVFTPEVTISGSVLNPSLTSVSDEVTYSVEPGSEKRVGISVTDTVTNAVNTYFITIKRAKMESGEHSTYLQKVKNPNHDDIIIYKDVFTYDLPISYGKVSVNLTPIAYDSDAEISVEGADFLKEDTGVIKIKVKDLLATPTERVYTFNYQRETSIEPVLDKYNFEYTGGFQTFEVPMTGEYLFEVWGAQGGSMSSGYPGKGGLGAYTAGKINLIKGTNLYVYVGGQGAGYKSGSSKFIGGYNGGGDCFGGASAGGGATDIRLVSGLWNDMKSLNSRLIVAGGGGGANDSTNGGVGGGLIGGTGAGGSASNGSGGTQTSGGNGVIPGVLGTGGGSLTTSSDGGAGGGGYFGGAKASGYNVAGGGGSSYASGYKGAIAVENVLNSNPRKDSEGNVCNATTASNDVTCSYFYDNAYIFSDIVMTSGGYLMPDPNGDDAVTGHSGNGYAVITPLSSKSENNFLKNITTNISKLEEKFDPVKLDYTIIVGMYNQYITLEGIPYDDTALITGDGKIRINVGENNIPIVVTAENGNTRTYNIKVIREGLKGNHSNALNYIELKNYDTIYVLPGQNNYNFKLNYNSYGVVVNAVTYDEDAIVEVSGNDVMADETGDILITVSHEDGSIPTEVYTITYQRQMPLYSFDDIYEYSCEKKERQFTAFLDGEYLIEAWGAAGGGATHSLNSPSRGGNGGYSQGTIKLNQGDLLRINVGCAGVYSSGLNTGGGWNGGGHGGRGGYGGGGATDIRFNGDTYAARIMVAGGGGGADNAGGTLGGADDGSGGSGGGLAGEEARINGAIVPNTGGTQTSGYALGVGQSVTTNTDTGGAGGGYFGGKVTNNNNGGAGGGSGYVDLNYFNSAKTIVGNTEVPTFDGTGTMIGNSGDGHIKITPLDLKSENDYLESIEFSSGSITPEFTPGTTEYVITVDTYTPKIELVGIPYDEEATVTGNGEFELEMGMNEFSIVVTSQNGTVREYKIIVNRPLLSDGSHSAELQKIKVEGYEDILCVQGIYEYSIKVPQSVYYLDVTPIPYDGTSTQSLSGFSYFEDSTTATITSRVTGKRIVYKINIVKAGAQDRYIWDYNYTGDYQEFIAPIDGTYKLEAWGAQGGNRSYNRGGRGAYATGYISMKAKEKIYVYVGASGNNGGFNGGGKRPYFAGGGGATDYRVTVDDLYSRFLVAGGGGSVGSPGKAGGAGGGPNGVSRYEKYGSGGTGATLTTAGSYRASFGVGGNGVSAYGGHAGAGGGGWYGGGGANPDGSADDDRGGGGGSSFALTSESITYTPYNYNVTENYYLTNTKLISGDGTMPSHDGYSSMTGNTGNGYAKITYVNLSDNYFLDSITVRSGQTVKDLNRTFNPEITEYSVLLNTDETKITLTARPADSTATINGLGTFDVPVGETTFEIVVTSESGKNKSYYIKTIREADQSSKPLNIEISGLIGNYCSMDPAYCQLACTEESDYCKSSSVEFDPDITNYTMTVPYKIKQLNFTVHKSALTQVVHGDGLKTLNGSSTPDTYVSIEVQSEYCSLNNDETSEGCITVYTFNITRDLRGDNDLAELNVVDPYRDIHFDPDIYEYTLSIPYEYERIKELTYVKDYSQSTVTISGNDEDTVMNLGYNYVYITVTAPNTEVQVYKLNVYREKSTITYLDHLNFYSLDKEGEHVNHPLSPEYTKNKFSTYDLKIPNDITEVNIDTAVDERALGVAEYTFTSKGVDVSSSGNITNIPVGYSFVYITVTAQDGSTDTYVVRINRLKNSDLTVDNIDLKVLDEVIELNEEFSEDILNYEASVPVGTKKVSFDVTIPTSTTKVTYPDGLNLVAGLNIKRVKITAEDGTSKIYTFNIYRPYNRVNTLSSLTVYNGEYVIPFEEEFNENTFEYHITVDNNVRSVRIVGELTDDSAKLLGSGKDYALAPFNNKITLTVISESGEQNYYTINIYRTPSDNVDVNFFTIEETGNVINVLENVYEYTVSVGNDVLTATIIPTLFHDGATYEIIEGENPLVTSHVNTFKIRVTAEDGEAYQIYTINIYKDKSDNANLEYLTVLEGALSPEFDPYVINYTVKVPYDITVANYRYETEKPTSSVVISGDLDFEVGENTVLVTVIPESGEDDKKVYTLTIIRQEFNPLLDTLSDLSISSGELTPTFSPSTLYYEVEVLNEVDEVYVAATPTDAASMVTGCGHYDLSVGRNEITIRVYTSDGNNQRDYRILVIRKGSTDARIKNLALDGSLLEPDFNPDIYSYDVVTSKTKLDFSVIELMKDTATYEICDNYFVDPDEEHIVKIIVTAEDNVTTKTYIFNVTRVKSSNAYLKSLSVDGYNISPTFNKNTSVYNLFVAANVGSVVVKASAEDEFATVSGTGAVILESTTNYIEVVVEAEDETLKTYTIVVNRTAGSVSTLRRFVVNNGVLNKPFVSDDTHYEITVPYDEDVLDISYNTTDPYATAYVTELSLDTSPKEIVLVVTAEDGVSKTEYHFTVTKGKILSPLLAEMEVENYLLNPEFDPYTFNYDIILNNEDTEIEFSKLRPMEEGASVVYSNLTGFDEDNKYYTVTIDVTSESGESQTYTIRIYHQEPANNYLNYITYSLPQVGESIYFPTPTFNKLNETYYVTVDNDITRIILDAGYDKNLVVNGLGEHTLTVGTNILPISVSENNITRTYIIKVIREASDSNLLNNLIIKSANKNYTNLIQPLFDPLEHTYTLEVEPGTSYLDITGSVSDRASVSGLKIWQIEANKTNLITITVTSESGDVNTYTISVTRPYSEENTLIDLVPSAGYLDPSFKIDKTTYDLYMNSSEENLSFAWKTKDGLATVIGNDEQYTPIGDSIRTIIVKSESGAEKTYTINIHRYAPNNAYLKTLTVKDGTFNTEFDPLTLTYDVTIPNSKKTLTSSDVSAIAQDGDATVLKSGQINVLTQSKTTYTIVVKAADGVTTVTYLLNVIREIGTEHTLKSLTPNTGYFVQKFSPTTTTYTYMVPPVKQGVSIDDFKYTLTDENSKIEYSDPIDMTEENSPSVFKIWVYAEDNSGYTEYTINLKYDYNSDNTLSSLSVEKGRMLKTFKTGLYSYDVYEYEDTLEEVVSATTTNSAASIISGIGIIELTGDECYNDIVVRAEDGSTLTYTLHFINTFKRDIYLDDLYIENLAENDYGDGEFLPNFTPDVIDYKVNVPFEYTTLNMGYTLQNPDQYIKLKINNTYVKNNAYKLPKGVTNVAVEVYDGLDVLTTTYNVEVTRLESRDGLLNSLTLINPETNKVYDLRPTFSSDSFEYEIEIPYDVNELKVKATTHYSGSIFSTNRDEEKIVYKENATAYVNFNHYNYLDEGDNQLQVKVTAPDGTVCLYIVHVIKPPKYNSWLQKITVSTGSFWELTPEFRKTNMTYTINMPSQIDKVTINAVADDPTTVVRGVGDYELEIGMNIIPITATAVDGSMSVYQIGILQEPNHDVDLSALSIDECSLSPKFDKTTVHYTCTVDPDVTDLTVNATAVDKKASINITGDKNLITGKNLLEVQVISKDKAVSKTYQIEVLRPVNDNANLAGLQVYKTSTEGIVTYYDLDPDFESDTTEYNVLVPYDVESVIVTVVKSVITSKTIGTGVQYLNYGENDITIKVIAEDNESNKTYHLKITRAYDFRLKEILTSSGVLSPEFTPTGENYTLTLPNKTSSVYIEAHPMDANINIFGNGTYNVLKDKTTVIPIILTAPDGTFYSYKINAIQMKNDNPYADMISISEGALSPTFTPTTKNYHVNLKPDVIGSSLTIDVVPSELTTTYEIIGNSNLQMGENTIKVKMTAEDGTIFEYNIIADVKEAEFFVNKLDTLNVTIPDQEDYEVSITPDFNPDINSYVVTLPNSADKLNVSATAQGTGATVSGTGVESVPIGRSVRTISVTSPDGEENIYSLNIYRLDDDPKLASLFVKNHDFLFIKTTYTYDIEIDSSEDILEITPTPVDPNATVTITGNGGFNLGNNQVLIKVETKTGATQTYTLNVSVKANNNPYLDIFEVVDFEYSPEFDATADCTYHLTVLTSTNSVYIKAIPKVNTTTVTGDGVKNLSFGNNTFNIDTVAEDGTPFRYKIVITRPEDSNSALSSIEVTPGELDPTFKKEITNYSVTLPAGTTAIRVNATAESESAVISGNDTYYLTSSETVIPIWVTAANGSKTLYEITVTLEDYASSLLASLRVKEGELIPNFMSEGFNYTVIVPYEIDKLNFVYATVDDNATVHIRGNENFEVGMNKVEIIVLSSGENPTQSTYTINVVKQAFANNYLKDISVVSTNGQITYQLTPEFNQNNLYYEVKVPYNVEKVKILASKADVSNILNSNTIGIKNVSVGENVFPITVYSTSGYQRTYTVVVTRQTAEESTRDGYLLTLEEDIEESDLSPDFDPSEPNYSITVPSDTSSITFTGTSPNGTSVTGLGKSMLKYGVSQRTITVTGTDGNTFSYYITITRPYTDKTKVLNIIPSVGELNYQDGKTEYDMEVPGETDKISFIVETYDPLALVTGNDETKLQNGLNIITITIKGTDGEIKKIHIFVTKLASVDAVTLEKKSIILDVGETMYVDYEFTPADTDYTDVVWSSDDEEVASVAANGLITALKVGTTSINVTSTINSNATDSLNVEVINKKLINETYGIVRFADDSTIEEEYVYTQIHKISISDFVESFDNKMSLIHIYDATGEELDKTSTSFIGTGMHITLELDNTTLDRLVIVVKGDINGDGVLTSVDINGSVGLVLGGSSTWLEKTAIDANVDNRPTSVDVQLITNVIQGKSSSIKEQIN